MIETEINSIGFMKTVEVVLNLSIYIMEVRNIFRQRKGGF